MMHSLAVWAEMEEDKESLRKLGLDEEEIAGYIDFFIENYFRSVNETAEDLRLRVPEVRTCPRSLVRQRVSQRGFLSGMWSIS